MRRRPVLSAAVVLATAFCACRSGTTPSASSTTTIQSARPSSGGPEALAARMRGHDAHGAQMRDAVARGDLDTAHREARALAALRDDAAEPSLRRSLGATYEASSWLAQAPDVPEASRALASVARTCGDCHALYGRPGTVAHEAPHASGEVVPRMQRHAWAVERLWDGLVVPSEEAWHAGARALAEAPLEPERLTPGKSPVPEVAALADAVAERAEEARVAESPADRAAIFAHVMATCASCHAWLRGGPPGRATR